MFLFAVEKLLIFVTNLIVVTFLKERAQLVYLGCVLIAFIF